MSCRPTGIVIAKVQVEDLLRIVQLEQESDLSSWGISGYERELLNPQAVLLVAHDEISRSVVGFFSGHQVADEFELLSIAVQDHSRHMGIGSALLLAGYHEIQSRCLNRCWLEVRSMNDPAIKLYEKFGFRAVGRRRNYYAKPPDDALVMRWEK